jgi:hypothetical protein
LLGAVGVGHVEVHRDVVDAVLVPADEDRDRGVGWIQRERPAAVDRTAVGETERSVTSTSVEANPSSMR